ncbi:MAG: transporter [Verrucomicrobia bacterium]|nr:MAG: transporter [Verrucomicrobiota bacterium]
MKKSLICLALATVCATTVSTHAEEGAGGHYVPGATASFIDALPGKPAIVVANAFTYYDGKASVGRPIDFGGQLTLNAHATCYADSLVGVYETPLQLLGGNYAVSAVIPFIWLDVKGTVGPANRSDSASGLGDITLYPFMLGWTNGPDLKYDVRLGIYAPSGDYTAGKLANTGRNYWTFEPAVSVSWLSTKIGTEVTVFAGVDFNTKNTATDYESGTSFHLEGTIAQHLPLGKLGIIGVGANGFLYQQISADSGSGATLGDFEGRTAGVGPVISFITKVGGHDLAAEVKWLPELNVEKRLKGDTVWFKLGLVF